MKLKQLTPLSLVTLLFFCWNCSTPEKKQAQKPNILFIMSDDHAYQAISAYGFGLNETPNIDRIAERRGHFYPRLRNQLDLRPKPGRDANREAQFCEW